MREFKKVRKQCVYCGLKKNMYGQAMLCFECRKETERMRMAVGSKASSAVSKAVANGDLPRLDGSIKCVDCGDPAKNYDHRDYDKPLDVSPVCISCNAKRGPAKQIFDLGLSFRRKHFIERPRPTEKPAEPTSRRTGVMGGVW